MKRILYILPLLLVLMASCVDDFDEWGYVNFYIDPESTEYYNLNYGNRGWEYFYGGNRGIIICRNSATEFRAYERSCVNKNCSGTLVMDSTTNVLIQCPECGGEWLSYDGSPVEKASRNLYEYCCGYDYVNLYVHNCAYN